jgi:hypothetical protein
LHPVGWKDADHFGKNCPPSSRGYATRPEDVPRIKEDQDMISIRTSSTAMAVSIAFFVVAFVGSPGCAFAQSNPLSLKSGDGALPDESKAVVGGRESIADKFFHLDWSVAPGSAGMSRITG